MKLLNDTIKENEVDEEWVINSFNSILRIETKLAVKLFKIYARNNNWRENDAVRIFAKNSTCLRKQADDYLRNMSLSSMLHTYNWDLDDEDENDESLSEKLKRWGYNIEEDPVISIEDIADLLWEYNYGWY